VLRMSAWSSGSVLISRSAAFTAAESVPNKSAK
jgi:hypothetical protein